MRMRPFLRNRRRLHQLAIDVPIDLGQRVNDPLRIILCDDGRGFFFARWGYVAVVGNGQFRSACLFLRDRLCWFFRDRDHLHRLVLGLRLGTRKMQC